MPTGVFDRGPGSKWHAAMMARRRAGTNPPPIASPGGLARYVGPIITATVVHEPLPRPTRAWWPEGARPVDDWQYLWTRRPRGIA